MEELALDLAQVAAFAVTARTLHFGQAAAELSISQQALSKRIARLEQLLGVPLLVRGHGAVELTEGGRLFLEPAQRVLAAGREAVAAVRGQDRPLRLDVWGHLYSPTRSVADVLAADPGLRVQVGPIRDLPALLAALGRGETDAGFGRVPAQAPAGLRHRLVRLEPVDAVLSERHPLAGADTLRPRELAGSTMWFPAPPDRVDYLSRFADEFGIAARLGGPNLGLEHFVEHLRTDPLCFSLFPADAPLPPGLRSIPLVEPTPLYPWSLAWIERPPGLDRLLEAFAAYGRDRRWLEYDPRRDWLPA
ncbi:LysR family transcriptional regulator [Hamadaea tsunoensis]|uniref:LysR family transcriptional regulator n=1 Tax=Hamadaea tsunoensis TaxID=53368 RepID=UPI0003F7B17C|nr:LysR family transcriptional regulator [Hamadaea tsunoensis]